MRKDILVAFILSAIFFAVNVIILPNYGVNWDEPTHFMRGATFLNYILFGNTDFSHLPAFDDQSYTRDFGYEFIDSESGEVNRRSIYQYFDLSFFTQRPEWSGSHPPLANILAALFNYILFQSLGIYSDVHAYNVVPVFLSAVLIGAVYLWTGRIFGRFAGLVSALSLGLFPLFHAESHYNIKDVPQAVFFSLGIMSFYYAVTTLRIRYVLLFIASVSFAFAIKLNILFSVFVLGPWLVYYLFSRTQGPKNPLRLASFFKQHKRFTLLLLSTPFFMLSIFILSWPAIWFNPAFLQASFAFYINIGTTGSVAASGFSLYPVYHVVFATPLAVLFYAVFGCIRGISLPRAQRDVYILVILWFLVPIVRVMVPGTAIYGGVRQIMEYIPAMAILSGIGAREIAVWLHGMLRKQKIYQPLVLIHFVLLFSFIPLLLRLIFLHPNEGVFFNSLIGGLKGAHEKGVPDAGITLGNQYRQGIDWLNEHAEPNAKIAFAHGNITNIPRVWMRHDLKLSNTFESGLAREGEYIINVTDKTPYDDLYRVRYAKAFLKPVHQIVVDGVPILNIWKNDREHTKDGYQSEEEVQGVIVEMMGGKFIALRLPQERHVTRIEFDTQDTDTCPIDEYAGRILLYTTDQQMPDAQLPAQRYNVHTKLPYKEPYFLLAAEPAQVVRLEVTESASCLLRSVYVRVFAL